MAALDIVDVGHESVLLYSERRHVGFLARAWMKERISGSNRMTAQPYQI